MTLSDHAPKHTRHVLVLAGGGAVGMVLLIAAFGAIGGPHTYAQTVANAVVVLVAAGDAPLAIVAGGVGLGRLFLPVTRRSAHGTPLRAALGLGLMLWVLNVIGSIHLSTAIGGRVLTAAPIAVGLALLAMAAIRRAPAPDARSARRAHAWVLALCLAAPATLLIAAALNPPGWLWASEFGGYDALSYHLQLPQEWLAMRRIAPIEHNVYSFLPSYMEGAYAQIGVLMDAARPYAQDGAPTGLLTGAGFGAIAAQLLHACFAIVSAWLCARVAGRCATRMGAPARCVPMSECIAGALFLATPWVIVTGSLAYNEMGMTAMFAGALLAALDEDLSPSMRAMCAGWLVGIACGAKPTALILVGAPVAIVLVGMMPARVWITSGVVGSIGGLVAIAPWLVRNWVEAGNPVFPYATALFGDAHWTHGQVERFMQAHTFEGSFLERLRLLVMPDATDPAGARHRGLLHPQWFAFFPAALGACACMLAWARSRRVAVLMVCVLCAQIVLWLFTTHVQSRFLLPCAVTGAVLVGCGAAVGAGRGGRIGVWGASVLGGAVCCAQFVGAVAIFASQGGGHPNARLLVSPSTLTGAGVDDKVIARSPGMTINQALPAGADVYLLGGAAPFYITRDVVYNTTWDAWPLGEVVRAYPDDPAAWSRALAMRGIDYVLIDRTGLSLFWRSGTNDPAVTPEVVQAWLDDPSTRAVRAFERAVLVELVAQGDER